MPLAAILAVATFAVLPDGGVTLNADGCPAGFRRAGSDSSRLSQWGDLLNAGQIGGPCVNEKHPESLAELEKMASQRAAIASAPDGIIPAGSFQRAVNQRRALLATGQDHSYWWRPIGEGPLQAGDKDYGISVLGNVELSARITAFDYIPKTDRKYPDTLLTSVSYGGVWKSDGSAKKWTSIGDSLPTQIIGAVAYTPANGGTVLALTGDGSFGKDSREGGGAYYTNDMGKTWRHAQGVPDETFGFRLAVNKTDPKIVYAATGAGLFRSTDGGHSYVNTNLPTGDCAGKSNRVRACLLANMVTDVVVQAPGGTTDASGHAVMAAVGWRGGNVANPDGSIQAPANGIYVSDNGAPGSFTKSAATGFAPQSRIGRTELGAAIGPDQNHDFVYAMVQDAVLIRKGIPFIDAAGDTSCQVMPQINSTLPDPVPALPCSVPTVFNGLYVSPDFGRTWTLVADESALQSPTTGSALAVVAQSGGTGPGVQAWYNMWVRPDPTKQVGGVPTRLLFGLEEVWQNEVTEVPVTGPTAFKVVGRYFSGSTCMFLVLPACPTNRDQALTATTTTHPDQQDAIFVPDGNGGVTLVAGNDGGAYTQHVAAGEDFSNAEWGVGANRGFDTLLPYDAVRSADGTVWMGLQDNGTAKIVDIKKNGKVTQRGRKIMAKGGDGFFVAVHPTNGNIAYGEYVGGAIAATVDGGKTWSEMNPPITNAQFSNPFVMDPYDPNHLMIAGRQIVETGSGPGTSSDDWAKVFDLGTASQRGNADAAPSPTDPANQMTALDLQGNAAYVGFCGTCDVLNAKVPFRNGLATNVGGKAPFKRFSSQGWHFASAKGLPNRYITSIAIHPLNPKIVWVTLGGYGRPWTPPNKLGQDNNNVGRGHVFVSTDAGETFRNISANLPNTPVNWIEKRNKQIILATDIGVYISDPEVICSDYSLPNCPKFEVLGQGLPMAPVYTVRLSHGDPNLLIAASYGRGVWSYRFGPKGKAVGSTVKPLPTPKFLGKAVAGPFGFETDAEGWTTKAKSSASGWKRGQPGHASGTSFQDIPYSDDTSVSLLSPKMTLPARSNVKVSWWELRDTEPCCDFLTVDWSSDGYVWNPVRSIDGQNPDFPEFSEASVTFVAPAGELYLRFRMTSDQLVSFPPYSGVAIDDIKIER